MSVDRPVAFLLERIAEDETRAHNAGPERPWTWEAVGEHGYPQRVVAVGPNALIAETYTNPDAPGVDAEHIAAWHPVRVLAECEAKRRIVELHRNDGDDEFPLCSMCREVGPDAQGWPCDTLRALALPYADHPDYRPEEWAPHSA